MIEFPAPDPTLPILTGLHDTFEQAVMLAPAGREAGTAAANTARSPYENALRSEVKYVEKVANAANGGVGDVTLVYLAGLEPRKDPTPAGLLTSPANLRLKQGKLTGLLECRAEPVNNAAAYEWRYATSATPTAWQNGGITTAGHTRLVSLIAGIVYTVQVRAIGAAGPSDWSDPAMLMVI